MGVLSKGTDFTNGDQITDTSLDNLVDNATFTTSAVDEVSTDIGGTGAIIVKDEGITTGKLANSTGAGDGVTTAKLATAAVTADKLGTDAVTTAKILDANVTKAKIENLTDYTVLGNVSGGAAAPAEVTILDEDTLATDSATALATQQSIKAYIDEYALKYSGATGSGLQVSGTATYRDLDLSSVVGSNRALVIMELEGSSLGADMFFRTKGSTVTPVALATNPGWGASGGFVSGSTNGFTCVVITNASGVLEYTGTNATGISYVVQAYQKLR